LLVSSEDISRGQLVVLAVQKIPKKMRRGPGNCTPYHMLALRLKSIPFSCVTQGFVWMAVDPQS